MALFGYQNKGTNQIVWLHTPDYEGNPAWEAIGEGGGDVSQNEFDAHGVDTTNVHGIADTADLATADDVQAQVNNHAGGSDPHGDRSYADAQKLSKAANLSDLQSAASARTNLGLGTAATQPFGTTANTVAAGDDSRITGAAQKASNLSDLGSAAAARGNLGLGAAATLAVGTGTGTVAAGDDGRITGVAKRTFNVRDYGALGTASGDDLTAINNTLTAAAAYANAINVSGSGPLVVFPSGPGYRVTNTVNVPNGVDIQMDAPIIYAGPDGQTALVIGTGAQQIERTFKGLCVRRATQSTWLSESDIGILIRNTYWSDIQIREVRGFTIGLRCLGDGLGFVYNTVNLGLFYNNKIGLDLTNNALGWCNENLFLGGSWTNDGSLHNSIDRIGIRFGSLDSQYHNNANTFLKPSFEIKGGAPAIAAEGLCVYAQWGSFNSIRDARHESPDAVAIRSDNGSTGNIVDFQFSLGGATTPVFEDLGTRPGTILRRGATRIPEASARTIYAVEDIHKRACYYDGSTSVNVPGLTVATSGTSVDDARAQSGLTLNADYLEFTSARMLGFYVSTRSLKRFTLLVDAEGTQGGRLKIRAFDASNAIISTAGAVRSSQLDLTYATSYGGAWSTGSDTNAPRDFVVSSAVDHIFVGIAGGSAAARLRAIRLTTPDVESTASAWLPLPDNGENFGTTTPTGGTWNTGRRIWNAAPTPSVAGWICTAGGTPGTWTTFGGVVAPDTQEFTTSGTWTKPAGARTVRVGLRSGGGQGGGGCKGADGGGRCGGGGGGGAAMQWRIFDAADLGSTVAVTVGAGGTGAGGGATANTTSGTAGANGGTSSFGTWSAMPGFGGAGGTTSAGAGGAGPSGASGTYGSGGAATANGGVGGGALNSLLGSAGGGAGGGINSSNTAFNGGPGGGSYMGVLTGVGNAGAVDASAPTSGTLAALSGAGNGAGGGAASITTNAQNGANAAANSGGGGGGGGAAKNDTGNAGTGGNGGSGYCIVITEF